MNEPCTHLLLTLVDISQTTHPPSLVNIVIECPLSLKPKVLGVCNAPSTNGSYGYIGIGGGNLLTLPTPVVKPNTTPAVI